MKVDEFRKADETLQRRRNKIDELRARKKANPTKVPKPRPKRQFPKNGSNTSFKSPDRTSKSPMRGGRPKSYSVGDIVKLADMPAYQLPGGLSNGQAVTVSRIEFPRIFVRDDSGREWDLFLANIDSGMDYRVKGRWVPSKW